MNKKGKSLTEKKISSKLVHKGKSFSFYSDEITLPNGNTSKRDYVIYPEACAVLPFIKNDYKEIVMVRQYRYPIDQMIYEIPAGKVDNPGEDKKACALRELLEETGYKPGKINLLLSYYPTAAYSTEKLYIFYATELIKEAQNLDEDEFLDVVILPYNDVLSMIKKGDIVDSKTILSLMYFENYINNK